jgi:hypothetical protein
MKVMLTITGPFEGMDVTDAEQRTMTIGERDAADLPRAVAEWAHDVTARMLNLPAGTVEVSDVPISLWEDLTDAA